MTPDEIFEKVKTCLVESGDVDESAVSPEKTLIEDLEMDSIDLIDLLYQLETAFSISIPISEIEDLARKDLGDAPFEVDTVITPEGLESLRKHLPEIPKERFKPGLTVQDIPFLFSVSSICNLIAKKLEEQQS